ncbi:MAG: tetratricopeptide repeat protein [Bryobacteraceae bacterium]
MASDDFEIFSTAGEGDTRRALEQFQQVSGFFASVMQKKLATNDPTRIIIFGAKKEYEPYKPNEVAIAFYTQTGGRDYIVLGAVDDDSAFHVAIHEYVHLLVEHGGLKLPPWLNEGTAELYSTLKPLAGKILVGSLVPGRIQALNREKWVPLATILAADHNSPYYNEKNRAGSLYNEGWALTHMLTLTNEYGPGYSKFLAEIQAGTPSQQALEKIYGKPLEAIEKSVQAYVRGDRFKGSLFDLKLQKTKEKAAAEPAPLFDVQLALTDLMNRPGKQAETRRRLEALASEDPKRPEPHVGLGYLTWREGQAVKAVESFEKAFALGGRNPKMLWDFGRLAGNSKPDSSIAALRALLEQEPDRRDVRLTLAEIEMSEKKATEALEALKPVKSITPEEAPRLFRLLAYANLEASNHQAARSNALRWIESTQKEDEKENAKRLVQYLDNLDRAPKPVAFAPTAPTLTDPRPLEPRAGVELALPSVSGKFIEMQCDGPRTRIVVESESVPVVFTMDDPDLVTAYGNGAQAEEITVTCGKQKPVDVRVQYTQASMRGVLGIAKRIRFDQKPEALVEAARAEPEKLAVQHPFAVGTLVELDCGVSPVRLVLQTQFGRQAFLMDSPETLVAFGLPDGKGIDIGCGTQKPVAMWIEYETAAKAQPGVQGLARALHYEPLPTTAAPSTVERQPPQLKRR